MKRSCGVSLPVGSNKRNAVERNYDVRLLAAGDIYSTNLGRETMTSVVKL